MRVVARGRSLRQRGKLGIISRGRRVPALHEARPLDARFIVLEGVEGSGKSTQVRLLADALARAGEVVVTTFEPGATAAGREIRHTLLSVPIALTALAEMLLFCADRAQHVHEVIRPALEAGKVVVSDRYELSTVVYQGYAGEVGVERAEQLNDLATGGLHPDLTVVMDLDPAAGLRRAGALEAPDRMERKALEFHQRVREGFLWWADRHPAAALVVDATEAPEEVHRRILARLGLDSAGPGSEEQA